MRSSAGYSMVNILKAFDDRVNQMMEDVTNSSTGVTEVVNKTITEA